MANANGVDVGFWLVVWQIVGQAIPSLRCPWRQGKDKLERPSETDSGTEQEKHQIGGQLALNCTKGIEYNTKPS